MQTLNNEKLRVWGLEGIETDTLVQAETTGRLSVVDGVALMPDAHVGKGSTVGSVIATEGAIIPAAVGVDIGCGMTAAQVYVSNEGGRQPLHADDLPVSLVKAQSRIAEYVPSGLGNWHADSNGRPPSMSPGTAYRVKHHLPNPSIIEAQLGTLGSGNHFIEVSLDQDGFVWIVLHSGSRGIGNQLATLHIRNAKGDFKKWSEEKLEDQDLAYFIQDTQEFRDYWEDLSWAQDYAQMNRDVMLRAVVRALEETFGYRIILPASSVVRCHHNYSSFENGRFITRKGAISARSRERGVIPGSMGTSTYVVSGLGNAESYYSAPHGAGRRMSRTRAKKELSAETLHVKMDGKAWDSASAESLVDEHPAAYKDVSEVIAASSDLVVVDYTLDAIINHKGV